MKSRMSLLRAGVDMLRSCPAVSLKEKSPVRPPHPPAQRPNHCGSPPPPRLHKQPCNDVSLRRLQIPPPSACTTTGGGGGASGRARGRGPCQGPSSGLISCGEPRRARSLFTPGAAGPRPPAAARYLASLPPSLVSGSAGRGETGASGA